MRVLVTGATGFVGRYVVKALLSQGIEVRALVRDPLRERILDDLNTDIYYGSVTNRSALRLAMVRVDAVVHLVAVLRQQNRKAYRTINHQGTWNVVSAAKAEKVNHLVHMSLLGVKDSSKYPYLYSRWLGEQEVIKSGIPYTILRPSFLFGPGDQFITVLAALAKLLPLIPTPRLDRARFQPMSVEDLAKCVALTVGNEDLMGKVVELGGPEHLSYSQVLRVVLSTCSLSRARVPTPLPVLRLIAAGLSLLFPRTPLTNRHLDMLAINGLTRLEATEETYGFSPRPLAGNIEYIRRLSRWDALRIALGLGGDQIDY